MRTWAQWETRGDGGEGGGGGGGGGGDQFDVRFCWYELN